MKKLLFLTLFLSQLNSFSQYGGYMRYVGEESLFLTNDYVEYFIDTTWQVGEHTIPEYGNTGVVAIDLNQATSHPGEYILASSFNPDYSPIGNCLDWPMFKTKFKNLGIKDSTGLLIELSWDSITWYNMADSIQVSGLFEATGSTDNNPLSNATFIRS
jgi:hypothetical protein